MAKFITWENGNTTELLNIDTIANAYNEKNGTRIVLNIGLNDHGDTFNMLMPFPIKKLFEAIKKDCIIAEIK